MPKIIEFPSEDNIPVFAEVADRVEFIADLMESLVWKRGKSAKVLAKAWNLSKSAVENYSAEASRMVTADRDTAARDISVICASMMAKAYRDGKAKDAAVIGKLWAEVSGANAPQKQEITIDAGSVNADRARKLMNNVFGGTAGKDGQSDENESENELEPTTDD